MGIFNEQPSSTSTTSSGVQGLQGLGFKLNSDGDYDMENKKLVNVKNGDNENDVMNKRQIEGYVENKLQALNFDGSKYVAKAGDTMTGSLIVSKDNYPVRGDLNKVISYETQREIFLSKKEGGQMEQNIDMNNNTIYNVKDPEQVEQATNKKYVDNQFVKKLDKAAHIDMQNKYDILRLKSNPYPIHSDLTKVINYQDTKDIFLSK